MNFLKNLLDHPTAKTLRDRYKYIYGESAPYLWALCIAAVGLFTGSLPPKYRLIAALTLLVISLLPVFRTLGRSYRDFRKLKPPAVRSYYEIPTLRDVFLESKSAADWTLIQAEDNHMLVPKKRIKLNRSWNASSIRYELPEELRQVRPFILLKTRRPYQEHGKAAKAHKFNGKLAGLLSDPQELHNESDAIYIREVGYYDAECTNELSLYVNLRNSDLLTEMVHRLVFDFQEKMIPLAYSESANIIGISLIAITSDNKIVFTRQSKRNAIAPGLLASSSSGSMDWVDLNMGTHKATEGTNFEEIIRFAMLRELAEEAVVNPDEVINFAVTGYYRWLERGAKPEFTGIARLNVTLAEIENRKPKRNERGYTSGVTSLPFSQLLNDAENHLKTRELPTQISLKEPQYEWSKYRPEIDNPKFNPSCTGAWLFAAKYLAENDFKI